MDKRIQLLGKIGTILADFIGIIVMLMALAFAFARENPVLFVILAAVVCPLWYKVVQKYWLKERPIVSALIRAVILTAGYLLLTKAISWFPYNRCYESVAKENFQKSFEEINKDAGYTFDGVGDIAKKEMWDYMKLTAVVSYKDKDGQTGSQDMLLYFDRLDGKYYKDFDALKEYRQAYRKEYKSNSFRNRLFFNEEELDAKIEELNDHIVKNEYDAVRAVMDTGLADSVTEEVWRGWQEMMASLGTFQKQETPTEKNWSVTDDEEHIQTMEVKETLVFSGGRVEVTMVFHDDLTLQTFNCVKQ